VLADGNGRVRVIFGFPVVNREPVHQVRSVLQPYAQAFGMPDRRVQVG
jgi:hypothetical protein